MNAYGESDIMYEYEKSPISADIWLGIRWDGDNGEKYITVPSMYNGKRFVELNETTFVDTYAIGAMHFYASLTFTTSVIDENSPNHYCGGYLGKATPKNWNSRVRIDVVRRLDRVERDLSGNLVGKVGEFTSRFNSEEEAHQAAILAFHKCFGAGWVLRGYDTNGNFVVFAER